MILSRRLLLDEVGLTGKTKKSLEEYISRMHVDIQEEVQHDEVQPEGVPPKPETPMQKLKRKKYSETSDTMFEDETSAAERELAMYLKMKDPAPKVTILQFWKTNRGVLPLLSKAAQSILPVPCASSSVERV